METGYKISLNER